MKERRYGLGEVILPGVGLISLTLLVLRTWPDIGGVFATVAHSLRLENWVILGLAAGILLLGHVLRAARTKVPIDNVRPSTIKSQFHSLAIGYFFNIVLPLRIGEVVRSFLVARKLHISFLYTLLAVILERLIDVILVATAFLGFSLVLGRAGNTALSIAAVIVILTSLGLIGMFVLLVRENSVILRVAWKLSSLLNTSLQNRVRFKIWSVIFGFQRFFRRRGQLLRYALLVGASWGCYVLAAILTAITIFPALDWTETVVAAATPYAVVSPSIDSAAPALYLQGVDAFMMEIGALQGQEVTTFAAATWLVLNAPIFMIGLFALFFVNIRRSDSLVPVRTHPNNVYMNKLGRDEDISQQFPMFLETYFQRQRLSQVLHKLEVSGNISLVRFFKGGSNAVTVLVLANGELYVKKLVPLKDAAALKMQHDWLSDRGSLSQLVSVLREDKADEYYAIDLEYRPLSVSLFDYLHERPLVDGTRMLSTVWSYLFANVYQVGDLQEYSGERDAYVKTRLIDRVRAAAESHGELACAMRYEQIVVNGRLLDNFDRVISRIQNTEAAWGDLAMYQGSATIHGDLTVDNILVDMATGDPLIIDPDPSPDNQVCGPVIDFARHMQSLQFGYECLNEDESGVPLTLVGDGPPEIIYRDRRSARYAELADYVTTEIMTNHLSGPEQRSVLFYAGLCFGRMMTHRVVINPTNALKYYGVCVAALNGFLDQYEVSQD